MVNAEFERRFRDWVGDACSKWGLTEPSPEFYERFYLRIPEDQQRSIVRAIDEGLVTSRGLYFDIRDGREGHGPYKWFSNRESAGMKPDPNWEYFVEVPEFQRYHDLAARHGMAAFFEHPGEVDVSLSRGGRTVLICEVKEKAAAIQKILVGLRACEGTEIDLLEEDRGRDILRKAKYIIKTKPDYFCLVAIGSRRDFKVTYLDASSFSMKEEPIPWN